MREKNILVVEYLPERVFFFIERFGNQNLDITESSNDGVRYLIDNIYDCMFLGGELGKYGGSCFDIAEFLYSHYDNPNNNSLIVLHSWNLSEVESILKLLPTAKYLPYNEASLCTMFDF